MQAHRGMTIEQVSISKDICPFVVLEQHRRQEKRVKPSGLFAGRRQEKAVTGLGKTAELHPAPRSESRPRWQVARVGIPVATNYGRNAGNRGPLVGPCEEKIILCGSVRQAPRHPINRDTFHLHGLDSNEAFCDTATGLHFSRQWLYGWSARQAGHGRHSNSITTQHGGARTSMVSGGTGFTPNTTKALTPELIRHDFLYSGVCRGFTCKKHISLNLLNLPFLVENGCRIDNCEGNNITT